MTLRWMINQYHYPILINKEEHKDLIAKSNEALKQGREAIARLDKTLNKEK